MCGDWKKIKMECVKHFYFSSFLKFIKDYNFNTKYLQFKKHFKMLSFSFKKSTKPNLVSNSTSNTWCILISKLSGCCSVLLSMPTEIQTAAVVLTDKSADFRLKSVPSQTQKFISWHKKQTTNFPVPYQTQVWLKISELSLILGTTRIHLKSDSSQNQVRLKISELSLILGMTRIHLKSDPSHSQIFLTWLWEHIVSENLIRLKSDSDSASYMGSV